MTDTKNPSGDVKVYRRRWLILFLNFAVFVITSTPWMQYVIVSDVITEYYGVSNQMVEWTTLIFNATAIIFTFPAAWFLDKYGLRPSFLVAAIGAVVGQWVKVLGCWPDRFWLILLGQTILAVCFNFIMSTPPRLAAVWFPAEQLSMAVGASLVGQMGGVSLGCALAPLSMRSDWTPDENFTGLLTIHLILAGAATAIVLATFFLFRDAPPLPPSPAQAAAAVATCQSNFRQSMVRIFKDFHFNLLLVGFSLITAVYIAMTTLLNRAIVEFFPDRSAETGWLAMLITLCGLFGMIIASIILDKTKLFKEVTVIVYLVSFLCLVGYTVALAISTMEVVYWIAAVMGLFMTSFFVPAYEMGAELTYPEPEGNPTSILNFLFQPMAMLVTLAASSIFTSYGATAGHGFMCALLGVGLLAVSFIPKRYRRRDAELTMTGKKGAEFAALPDPRNPINSLEP